MEHVLRHHPERKEYTVSLLNNQNAKRIVPLYGLEFSLQLDVPPLSISTTLGTHVSWNIQDGVLHLKVDKLDIFDVVHIAYG